MKKESCVFTSRSLIRCIPSREESFCEITRIYRVQVLSNTGDELFTPRGRCIPPRRAAANSVCAAAAHKPSPRSKSNTPIPLRGTTKVFPAATWYSVRRSCVEMPRTHSAGEGSASPGGPLLCSCLPFVWRFDRGAREAGNPQSGAKQLRRLKRKMRKRIRSSGPNMLV